MVIFSRNLKVAWLNEAAGLWREKISAAESSVRLNEFLAQEIGSPTNLRKTREILMRLWFYDGASANLRGEAASLLKKFPNEAAAIHWGLLLATYPIFAELSKIIGRLFELGEVVTVRQIRQKLFDALGERTTLLHSTDKILVTLREFGILVTQKPGQFTLARLTVDDEITALLIRAALTIDGGIYRRLSELEKLRVLYPFRCRVSPASLDEKIFTITNLGGEQVVMLKEIR